MPIQVAVLDDYQEVARELAPWEQLEPEAEITFFHDHLLVDGVVRDLLEGFEVVVAMRERTPFTAKRLASLSDLKLLVTTGMANASIDMDAAREHGITLVNSPGTIDCDYTGEIVVLVINHGDRAVRIEPGQRIAQLVIAPVVQAELVEVSDGDRRRVDRRRP